MKSSSVSDMMPRRFYKNRPCFSPNWPAPTLARRSAPVAALVGVPLQVADPQGLGPRPVAGAEDEQVGLRPVDGVEVLDGLAGPPPRADVLLEGRDPAGEAMDLQDRL